MSASCETCRFWDMRPQVCRRAPPRDDYSWPSTYPHDWCGEYEHTPRPAPPDTYDMDPPPA